MNEFVRSHDLAKVDFEKRTIIDLYRADILKYGGRSKHKILCVFNAIPGVLASHEWQFSPGGVRKVITSVSWGAIDFPNTTIRSRESNNIASSI